MTVDDVITIAGITYVVRAVEPYVHDGKPRVEIKLQRPRGDRFYYVVRYETGALSSVV